METKTFPPNKFNKYFTNISYNLAKYITNSDVNLSIYDYLGGRMENYLYLKPADEEVVINSVKACTRIKSTYFENTSMDVVAEVIPVISKLSQTFVIFRLRLVCSL